uniref:Protein DETOXIFICATION n=2 Tax=Kalanchoe fedtschenkoi TaxID=63787 RepID=A0A7N0UX74_KALFE
MSEDDDVTNKPSLDNIVLRIDFQEINDENGLVEETNKKRQVIEEVKKQLWLAGPLVMVNVLQYFLQMISVMFVGHLGELALSGASLASSFANVTGFQLLLGMASALDTLCGQSYGAKQYHMLGIQMQKAMLILTVVGVPIAGMWAKTEQILVLVGQDPQISKVAGHYIQFLIPGLFAYGLLQCLVRFLQTQNIVFPMMISSGITAMLHVLLCWILVFKSELGVRGAALANSISYAVNALSLAIYVKFSPSCVETWTGFSVAALHNILNFLRLAIPSALMVCLELWTFEMMVLLAGRLPNPQLETSVMSISLNTDLTVWTIPVGLSAAVSTRISNELGAGNSHAARLAVRVVSFMAISEGVTMGIILILIRNVWGRAYSKDAHIIKYVAAMMPLVALSSFLDGLQCVLSGIARGCGWQKIGAFINLGSYYLVGIPSAIVLGFVFHLGGKGLWIGLICALVAQFICLSTITIRTNWDKEAAKASKRVRESMSS